MISGPNTGTRPSENAVAVDSSGLKMLGAYMNLGGIERGIVDLFVERLAFGQESYGPFEKDDGRDFAREATEEALDGFVYTARLLAKEQGSQ
jgi:hypothetical protein